MLTLGISNCLHGRNLNYKEFINILLKTNNVINETLNDNLDHH